MSSSRSTTAPPRCASTRPSWSCAAKTAAAAATRATESLDRLGPDLCGDAPDLDAVLDRLATIPVATTIGEALLDQRVAAGIGNVFKSEICWARRVHPSTTVGSLSADARRALYETAHTQLRANLGPGPRVTYRGGLAVYRKARRPCPRCRTPIERARGPEAIRE